MIWRVLAVARRTSSQILRDRRALVQALVEPPLILLIVKYSMVRMQPFVKQLEGSQVMQRYLLNDRQIVTGFVVLMIFLFAYLLCAMTFVRERRSGTLERLLTYPVRRSEVVSGYLLGYGAMALVEAVLILASFYLLFGVAPKGSLPALALLVVLVSASAVSLSLWVSAYCRSEFQALQFIPLVVLPALLLSGLIFPPALLPDWLQPARLLIPITYGVDALRGILLQGYGFSEVWRDLLGLALFSAAAVAAGIRTIRPEPA